MTTEIERPIKDVLTVLSTEDFENTPQGFHVLPQYLHNVDDPDNSVVSIEALKTDKAKAARTLQDYAQAVFEIAATAENLALHLELDAPEFARMAKSARTAAKKLNGAAVTAKVIDIAKGKA